MPRPWLLKHQEEALQVRQEGGRVKVVQAEQEQLLSIFVGHVARPLKHLQPRGQQRIQAKQVPVSSMDPVLLVPIAVAVLWRREMELLERDEDEANTGLVPRV